MRKITNKAIPQFIYFFSAFKTKLQKIRANKYSSVSQFYEHLTIFQSNLQHLQKIKFKKALPSLQKKIKKLVNNSTKCEVLNNTKQQTQNGNYNKNNGGIDDSQQKKNHAYKNSSFQQNSQQFRKSQQHNRIWSLNKKLCSTITHQLFYGLQTKQYQPINENMKLNLMQIDHLYKIACDQAGYFKQDLQIAFNDMLSNPQYNQEIYQNVKKRCQHLQNQLSANVFEQYTQILKKMQMASTEGSNNSPALSKIKAKSTNKQVVFKQDFKFKLKQNQNPQINMKCSQVAKSITKYGFATQRIKMFSVKTLSSQGYKSLTPASLANHLFILGYFKQSVPSINQNIYKLFDIFCNYSSSESKQCLGQIKQFNSLIFYMLSNKIQSYQLLKASLQKILAQFNKTAYDHNKLQQRMQGISNFDKDLFFLILKILKTKHNLSIQQFKDEFRLSKQIVDFYCFQKMIGRMPKIQNSCHIDFQNFLSRKSYKYQKHSLFSKNTINSITQDVLFKIEDKNFLCAGSAKFNKQTLKLNGVGQIMADCFKSQGIPIKIINPLAFNNFERRSEIQQYFKSKMKGISQPVLNRQRRFQF